MDSIQSITPELSVAGQITLQELEQAAHAGYQSVLNLRSPSEEGFWPEEALFATGLGMHYVNAPVNIAALSEELTTQVLVCIDEMPKPLLIHCAAALRSGAMALMNIAICQGLTAEEALVKADEIGFDCNAHPQMKEFLTYYVDKYGNANLPANA